MFFMEESRAAQELMSLGKIESKSGPLKLMVKPCDPPKGGAGGSGGHSGGQSGGQSRGVFAPRSNFSHSGGRSIDDDISMDEDPSQVIKVSDIDRICMNSHASHLYVFC